VVLSGINHGANMGEDVLYSGTVAAAMEATVLGVPAIALSFTGEHFEELAGWEPVVRDLLASLLRQDDFPENTLLSVNLPPIAPGDVRGVRVTSLGRRRYRDSLTRATDPSGREYFWIGGGETAWTGPEGSDFRAVGEGYISVTPLHLDLTNYRLLETIRSWNLDLGGR
jgi:5'-nucleotidase